MSSEPYYNPMYGTPTPEHWEKVLLSQEEVADMDERDLKCPVCGIRIATVYSRVGHIKLKCPKCKFEGAMNLAYFRRHRLYRRPSYYVRSNDRR